MGLVWRQIHEAVAGVVTQRQDAVSLLVRGDLRSALLDANGGWLRSIREKPATDDPLAKRAERWVSMNVWSFTPVIFEACDRVRPSARGELEIQDAVTIAMTELGERFRVLPMRAGVLDLSSRADVALVASRLAGVVPRP